MDGKTKPIKLPKVANIKLSAAADDEAAKAHGMARATCEHEHARTGERWDRQSQIEAG